MYVNEEDVPLIASAVAAPKNSGRIWKFVATGVALSAIGLVAVSVNGGLSTYKSSASELSEKRLQMSKKGTLKYGALSDDEKSTLFDNFKTDFERKYSTTEEENDRFIHFKTFLSKVDERNEKERAQGGAAVHGVTSFSDLSTEEFSKRYLGFVRSSNTSLNAKEAVVPEFTGSVTSVNWADTYTTPVKNQGYCGSCWAFSATEQIEADSIRAGLTTTSISLSTQQIVSCDSTENGVSASFANYGCNGGFTETAYEYVISAGGITTEADYPYTSYYASTGTCDSSKSDYLVTVDDFHVVRGETAMENYVLSTGPLSVCLDASDWSSYRGGIVSSCGNDLNHCVQVTGVNLDDGYWIVRNSWGTDWGLDGFIYLSTGHNTCDITYSPTYVSVSAV